jgi:hypothetical protein
VACAGYVLNGFEDEEEVLLPRVGETRKALSHYEKYLGVIAGGAEAGKPPDAVWVKAMRTLFGRARQHGRTGGCPMVTQMLEEPYKVRFQVSYLAIMPLRFTLKDGSTSAPCAVLPHFGEMLATRAIKCHGYATGGFMRSTPGEAHSHSSHGRTMVSVMIEEARTAGEMRKRVKDL